MDKYVKIKKLGAGSYGKVFLAREKSPTASADATSSRLVCVKQIPLHRLQDDDLRAKFRNEGELMKKLIHPNLIRYLRAMETPSSILIVMEYCAGGDLRNLLTRRKYALSEQQVCYWFVQLALGLEHMHHHRILHRDIKSSNIFINNTGLVVLGDLGIARQLDVFQQAETMVGTPLYMSPEMIEGKSYDMRSDLWALGCVLYEMCVGQPPFTAMSTPALIKAICHGYVAPLPSHFSSGLQQVVKELLSVDPSKRPQIAGMLRSDCFQSALRRLVQDLRSQDERDVVWSQLQRLQVTSGMPACIAPTALCESQSRSPIQSLGPARNRRGLAEKDSMVLISREEQIVETLERLKCYRCDLLMPLQNLPPLTQPSERPEQVSLACEHTVKPSEQLSARLCGVEWRDPVQAPHLSALDPSPRRHNKSACYASSENMITGLKKPFLGIPRTGVPLTQKAKSFASGSSDVRDLRKKYVEKEAKQRGRQFRRSASEARTCKVKAVDKLTKASPREVDEALLLCMNELENALCRFRT